MSGLGALQQCLAAEHAALYGYGVLGGRLGHAAGGARWQPLAAAAYAEHRTRRGQLTRLLVDNNAEPVAAEPAYGTPFDVTTLAECRRLAMLIESRCAAVYANAVARTVADLRRLAARSLIACAVRETEWGHEVRAFPGVREL